MIISYSDKLMERLNAACDKLQQARNEYDARIAQAGTSHFSDRAATIRRQLKLDVLLTELECHLAKFERIKLRLLH